MMKLQDGILKAIAAELDRGGRSCWHELRPWDRCDLKMRAFGTTRIDQYWSEQQRRSGFHSFRFARAVWTRVQHGHAGSGGADDGLRRSGASRARARVHADPTLSGKRTAAACRERA